MYFNYTKYNPIVFQLQNTNYFCQGHKIQNTLNVFKMHVFQLLVFQLLQHCFWYVHSLSTHLSITSKLVFSLVAKHIGSASESLLPREALSKWKIIIQYNLLRPVRASFEKT